MAQEMAAAQTVSLSRESQQDTNKNPASLPTTSAHTEFDLEARKAIKAKAAELAAKSSTFYLEDDNTKALATEKETASAELKSKRAAMASSAAEHPEQKSEPIMSKKAAEEFSQLSEEDEKAKAAALAKQGGEAPEGDEKAKAIAVAKAKAAAAAKAKAAALAKQGGEAPEGDEKAKAIAAAKAKAAAAAKAKAAALAKQGGEAPEGDEKAKAIAAAKAKAAAAAKAKAAALAKQGGEAPEGDEKAKAIAAAKAKAAAAAKAKAAALVKQDGEAPEGDEKAKAIAAAKAKAAAAAKAKAAGAGKARPAVEPPADSKPSPNQKFLDKYIKVIEENLGTDILAAAYINPLSKDVPTLEVKVSAYYRTAEFLKYNEQLAFDYLSELHGTDFGSHFEVYVHLYSYRNSQSAAVKVRVDRENPVLPSLVPLWQGANWPESEAYDLLGIQFSNHPDLKRIMLGEGWIGHPLRKDYEPYDVEV
ncbi:NADH-quinone oxidoreductase subunit C [Peribacillus kribbensis]|uniref:NADH-quinone oxidoreductase subunit C n=1 Tax=Peribacillus kribbensis TaxID=356658 RepID=UPI003CCC103F